MNRRLIIKQSKIKLITDNGINNDVEFILAVPIESSYVPRVSIPSTYKDGYDGIIRINTEIYNYYEVKERTDDFVIVDNNPNLELYKCYDLCINAKLVNSEVKKITGFDYKKINSYLLEGED